MRRGRKPINYFKISYCSIIVKGYILLDWKTQETKLQNKLEFEDCKLKINFSVWAQMKLQATPTVCQISQAVTDMWINHTFATY